MNECDNRNLLGRAFMLANFAFVNLCANIDLKELIVFLNMVLHSYSKCLSLKDRKRMTASID